MVLGIRHLCDSGLGSTFCCVSKVCIVFKEGIKKARSGMPSARPTTLIEGREMADINARPRYEAHRIKGDKNQISENDRREGDARQVEQ